MTEQQGDNLYVVFSKPPAEISADEYNAWYVGHARDNMPSGFTSVARYHVETINVGKGVSPDRQTGAASGQTGDYSYLALYTYSGSVQTVRDDLARRVREGEIVLPPWFSEITFGSWACTPAG